MAARHGLDAPRTLASGSSTSGYKFEVIQYWNHVDFYTTELLVDGPDGRREVHVLDGDDRKSWSLPMSIDEVRRVVSVELCGGRSRDVSW